MTPKCNLNCKHCFAANSNKIVEKKHSELHIAEWKIIVDKLAEAKIFNILISGGEPFLFDGFKELCEYIISKRINISINTNATLLSEEDAEWMKLLPIRGRISVSLDGSSSEIHDYMRGSGAFVKTVSGITQLSKAGLDVQAFFVLTNHNWFDIENTARLAKQLGCVRFYINEIYPVGNGLNNIHDLYLSDLNYINAVDTCKKMISGDLSKFVSGKFINQICLLDALKVRMSDIAKSYGCNTVGCGNGSQSFVVKSDGEVAPCEMLMEVNCGNLLFESVDDVWKKSEVFAEFREVNRLRVSELTGCQTCRLTDICDGGCRAYPYIHGDIKGESLCRLRRYNEFFETCNTASN